MADVWEGGGKRKRREKRNERRGGGKEVYRRWLGQKTLHFSVDLARCTVTHWRKVVWTGKGFACAGVKVHLV